MSLKINTRDVSGVSVVSLDGRIVLGEESNAFRAEVRTLLSKGAKRIVLNIEEVYENETCQHSRQVFEARRVVGKRPQSRKNAPQPIVYECLRHNWEEIPSPIAECHVRGYEAAERDREVQQNFLGCDLPLFDVLLKKGDQQAQRCKAQPGKRQTRRLLLIHRIYQ